MKKKIINKQKSCSRRARSIYAFFAAVAIGTLAYPIYLGINYQIQKSDLSDYKKEAQKTIEKWSSEDKQIAPGVILHSRLNNSKYEKREGEFIIYNVELDLSSSPFFPDGSIRHEYFYFSYNFKKKTFVANLVTNQNIVLTW